MFERDARNGPKSLINMATPAGLEPATARLEGGDLGCEIKANSDISGVNAHRTSGQSLNSKSGQISPPFSPTPKPKKLWRAKVAED